MKYVDGYVLIVPKKNFHNYKKMAIEAGKIWKKHGALEYFECIGDDLFPKPGGMKILTFSKLTKAKKNENIWFSFIIFKSKKHRNQVNSKVMKEFKKNKDKFKNVKMPFDLKKMAFAGFKTIVEGKK